MAVRILAPADYRTVPWRNGLGTTVEIASDPPGGLAAGAPFLWRLSLADVGSDGPFSAFPGIDRTIMVVQGAGMTLTFTVEGVESPRTVTLAERFVPVAFSGDWRTDCRLLGGPVRDFNLMIDRARAQGDVRILKGTEVVRAEAAGGTVLVHVLAGMVTTAGTTLPAGHTLVADGDAARGFDLEGASGDTVAFIAGITMRNPA